MSDEFEDDEFEDEDEGNGQNLVKSLRKQLRAQKKANDEALAELRTFRAEQRKTNVARLIEGAGGNPAYAQFYNSEDASETAVKAWIEANSGLLGVQQQSDEDRQQAGQVERITFAAQNAPQPKLGSKADLGQNLSAARTREELDAAINAIFTAGRG